MSDWQEHQEWEKVGTGYHKIKILMEKGGKMEIIRKYMADFPKWYVQVEQSGTRVELNFDHNPSDEEVQIKIDEITTVIIQEKTVGVVGENGTVI